MPDNKTITDLAKSLRDGLCPDVSDEELEDALTEKFGHDGLMNANSILAQSNVNIEFVIKRAEEKLNEKKKK